MLDAISTKFDDMESLAISAFFFLVRLVEFH